MQRLDGKKCSNQLKQSLKGPISEFTAKAGRPPGLAVILIGGDSASQVYVNHKIKACTDVGIKSVLTKLPAEAKAEQVADAIDVLNKNPEIDGILLQLPLPKHLSARVLVNKISPLKDVDCLTAENLGLMWSGDERVSPCTPQGIIHLLKENNIEMAGKKAVVIGRSLIVGKPIFELLQKENATVTLCHSKTLNLKNETKNADIVIVAAGMPEFLKDEDFKEDAVVVDVGIHRVNNKLVGDVAPLTKVKASSPVPGGVGPMTIACLLKNTLKLAELGQVAK